MHKKWLFIFFLCLLFKTIESSDPIPFEIIDKISVSFTIDPLDSTMDPLNSTNMLSQFEVWTNVLKQFEDWANGKIGNNGDWANGKIGKNGDKKLTPGSYRGRTDEELLCYQKELKESAPSAFSRVELYVEYRVSEQIKISVNIPISAIIPMEQRPVLKLKIQVGEW